MRPSLVARWSLFELLRRRPWPPPCASAQIRCFLHAVDLGGGGGVT